jgi:hypothetical protein
VPSTFWLARRNGKPFITGNTFPPKLVEPLIKAATSERGQCPDCGAPWRRVVEKTVRADADRERGRGKDSGIRPGWENGQYDSHGATLARWQSDTTGWEPSCPHAADPVPQTVIDCFGGSGTVGQVADRLGRDAILCELKPDYGEQAQRRVLSEAPLFTELDIA